MARLWLGAAGRHQRVLRADARQHRRHDLDGKPAGCGVSRCRRTFVLTRMIPGTAVGVLVGDLIYTSMAFRLARRTGPDRRHRHAAGARHAEHVRHGLSDHRPSVSGSDCSAAWIPNTAARHAWFLGITMLLASGIFKIACAPFSGLDQKEHSAGGIAGIAGGDCAGADQFPAVTGHRCASGGGDGGAWA